MGSAAALAGVGALSRKKRHKASKVRLYELLAQSSIANPLRGVSGNERVKRAERLFKEVKRAGYPDAVGIAAIIDADASTGLTSPLDRRALKKTLKQRGVSVVGSHFSGNTLATVSGLYGLRVRRGGLSSMLQNQNHARALFPSIADVQTLDIKVK